MIFEYKLSQMRVRVFVALPISPINPQTLIGDQSEKLCCVIENYNVVSWKTGQT